jgi:hypothetical protein
MQFIGLVGESLILFTLPEEGHALLNTSITRFIIFDSIGLILLTVAIFITMKKLRE